MWLIYLFVCGFAVFVNVQEILVSKFDLSYLMYVDELIALSAYFFAPLCLRRRSDVGFLLVLLLPLFSAIHSVLVNFLVFDDLRLFEAFAQSFINFKLFFYLVIFYSIWIAFEKWRKVFLVAFVLSFAVSIIGYSLNLLYPEFFLFSDAIWHLERERVVGFQYKPNDLAILLSLFVFFVFMSIKGGVRYLIVAFIVFLVFMTSSRTALLVALVSILLVLVYERRYLLLYLFFCCGFFVVVFFGEVAAQSFFVVETLSNFSQFSSVDSTQYIRVLMIYYGAQLGLMFFPLGAGAGNFGGVLSADSPVYRLLGVSDINFFQGLSGIYDSNLAALIGEYGYFFAILIFVCCYKLFYVVMGRGAGIVVVIVFLLSLTQPTYAYQVNSVNILLLVFSLSYVRRRGLLLGGV